MKTSTLENRVANLSLISKLNNSVEVMDDYQLSVSKIKHLVEFDKVK